MPDDPVQPTHRPLALFVAGMEQRSRPVSDLLRLAEAAMVDVAIPLHSGAAGVPPRRVAVAMGLSLTTTPHFSAILPPPVRAGSVRVDEQPHRADDYPLFAHPEVLEAALGVPHWELEELREEIDRRAGQLLKQDRIATWLWSHFGLPDRARARSLAKVLFPSLPDENMDVVRRGSHLYVLADQPTYVPEAALWLPWLAPRPSHAPTSFRARAIDEGLRQRLARGVGSAEDELIDLLDGMIALLPRDDAARFLHLDQWRSSGRAAMSDLGTYYVGPEWLVRPVADEGVNWRAWMRVGTSGRPELRTTAEQVFDALALPRVTAMAHALYGLMLAVCDQLGASTDMSLQQVHLDLFDVPRHMRAVLNPLVEWAGRATTHDTLATDLGCANGDVAELLLEVREAWIRQAEVSWLAGPSSEAPSILAFVLRHLLATYSSLRRLMSAPPDPRSEHADALLLFTAHYLREGRLDRLWVAQLSDVAQGDERLAPTEDVPGRWFLPTLQRLLDLRDARSPDPP